MVFQSGTRVKNVYASLANGTLVVFTPASVSIARRPSHNDVTLETKEEDEQLTRERDKWSSVQVCDPLIRWPVIKISPKLFEVCRLQSVIMIFSNLFLIKFYFSFFPRFLNNFLHHKIQLNIPSLELTILPLFIMFVNLVC